MPRNSSGNYVLPTGNPVQANTLIESAWANLTMEDIATALTDSLDRNGRGGMLAPFQLADGIVTQPGLAFSNEPSMGIFREGARDMRATILGIPRMRWTAEHGTQNWDGAAWRTFGTAAYADTTVSATDSTVGRVTRVGDFGLGGVTPEIVGDMNDATTTGFFNYPLGSTNTPNSTFGFKVQVIVRGNGDVSQIAWANGPTLGALTYTREFRSALGTWTPWWQGMFREENLVGLPDVAAARTNLGLGTAAVENVTTSPVDNTSGRLLRVGSFGAGSTPFVTGAAVFEGDLNTLLTGGMYRLQTVTNGPAGNDLNFSLAYVASGGNTVSQILVRWSDGRMWQRGGQSPDGGATWEWSGWLGTLTIGWAGLGADCQLVGDLNTIQASGFYGNNPSSAPGVPFAGFWEVIHWQFDLNSASQIAQQAGIQANVQWVRNKSSGGWGAWTRTMFTGDNLGGLTDLVAARANLALGSGAVQNHTNSNTDDVNLLVGRGWRGLGGQAVQITDWNWAPPGNSWIMAAGAPNAPVAGDWCIGLQTLHGGDWISQEVWVFTDATFSPPRRFFRQCTSPNRVWGPWHDTRFAQYAAVGSYVWAGGNVSGIGPTELVAGSSIGPSGVGAPTTACNINSLSPVILWGCDTLPGTWRVQGRGPGAPTTSTLYLRIA